MLVQGMSKQAVKSDVSVVTRKQKRLWKHKGLGRSSRIKKDNSPQGKI